MLSIALPEFVVEARNVRGSAGSRGRSFVEMIVGMLLRMVKMSRKKDHILPSWFTVLEGRKNEAEFSYLMVAGRRCFPLQSYRGHPTRNLWKECSGVIRGAVAKKDEDMPLNKTCRFDEIRLFSEIGSHQDARDAIVTKGGFIGDLFRSWMRPLIRVVEIHWQSSRRDTTRMATRHPSRVLVGRQTNT